MCGSSSPIYIPNETIPDSRDEIQKVAGSRFMVDIDMRNSFHQMPLALRTSEFLLVSTPWGLFRPMFMPEGVGPASMLLQRTVTKIFRDYLPWMIVIFDNFLILGDSYGELAKKNRARPPSLP